MHPFACTGGGRKKENKKTIQCRRPSHTRLNYRKKLIHPREVGIKLAALQNFLMKFALVDRLRTKRARAYGPSVLGSPVKKNLLQ